MLEPIHCPSCGTALAVDVFTKEPRPCTECGAIPTLDDSGRLIPDAEHQNSINRQKYFEIATVITIIIVGFGYFAISIGRTPGGDVGSTTIENLGAILRSEGFEGSQASTALDREFTGFVKQGKILRTTIDLVGAVDSDVTEAIIFATSLPTGRPFPSDDIAKAAVQESFNEIVHLGELLVPASTDGLSKAANTTTEVKSGDINFRKGVAQTSSGWKITYIAYREYDENGEDIPLLLFIYQRLDAASNPALETFNEILFSAANDGLDIRETMAAYSEEIVHEN
jgi:hypothetical protein